MNIKMEKYVAKQFFLIVEPIEITHFNIILKIQCAKFSLDPAVLDSSSPNDYKL